MPKKKNPEKALTKTEGDISDLIGNSVSVKLADGTTVIVPTDRDSNRVASAIVAAKVRHLLEKSLKKYNDMDVTPTPKDLKDLAEAAASLARSSGEVYKEAEGDIGPSDPKPEKATTPAPVKEVNFDAAFEVKTEEKK